MKLDYVTRSEIISYINTSNLEELKLCTGVLYYDDEFFFRSIIKKNKGAIKICYYIYSYIYVRKLREKCKKYEFLIDDEIKDFLKILFGQ